MDMVNQSMDIKKTEHGHGICHRLGIAPPLKFLHSNKGIEQNLGKQKTIHAKLNVTT